VILPLFAFGLSFCRWFASYWRALTLTLCLALVGLGTAANVIRHESVPMFVETMLLLVGAGALVPWDERRQAALGASCLAAFAADQALAPMPDAYAHIRWLAMLGAVLVAQIAVHLSSLYRRELAAHCRALAAAREQALLASRAKSEFLSTISHEVRTPMNSVLGMAEVLAETNLDGDQRRYLETLRSNGSAMMKLLDDILDLAKVETGRLHLRNKEFRPRRAGRKNRRVLCHACEGQRTQTRGADRSRHSVAAGGRPAEAAPGADESARERD
jgi:signal transduction histidine kinase